MHPVQGYEDLENMWVKLCNNSVEPAAPFKQYPNDRSSVTIQVSSDKVFKLKKNPHYKDLTSLGTRMS